MQRLMTKPQHKITTEIVTVTPDIAASWLEKNDRNRKHANATITKFARDMEAGNWQLTGDAIRFDTSGRLLDGQHRLMACMRAKKAFQTFVMYGLDPLAQDVMDTGKVRKLPDVLSLRGIVNSNQLAAALRALIAYKAEITATRTMPITTAESIEVLERHPNITKSVAVASFGMPRSSPRATLALLHYFASTYLNDKESADRLIDVFKTGVPSYHGDVMHIMRERFIKSPAEGHRIDQGIASQTMHYAWNLFVQRKSSGILRWQKQFVDIDGIDRDKL